MATSTVYHHYPNIENLFHNLLDDVFIDFDSLLGKCIDAEHVSRWTDINRMIETAYVNYYNNNPIAKKLILGRHAFTELGHADTENDLILGKEVKTIYRQFFDVPPVTTIHQCLRYFCKSLIKSILCRIVNTAISPQSSLTKPLD